MKKKQMIMVAIATANIAVAVQNLLTSSLEGHLLVVGMTTLMGKVINSLSHNDRDTNRIIGQVALVIDHLATDLKRMRRAM